MEKQKIKPPRTVILIAGTMLLVAALRLLITTGLGNNTLFASGLSAALLLYGWQYERLIRVRALNLLISACAVFFFGLVMFIAAYGERDNPTYTEDVALVLGGGIRGEEISETLKRRLDTAVQYHAQNPGALLVVTGGQGAREAIPEALAMQRYLIAQGVAPESVLMEDQALSTYENMQYAKALLDQRMDQPYRAVVITSDFHIFRSVSFARMFGIDATQLGADTPWYTLPVDYARECAAVLKQWIFKI